MANTYVKIGSTVTVGAGGAASISFSSIPSTYTDLQMLYSIRNTADVNTFALTINGVSTNQTARRISGSGSAASSSTYTEIQGNASSATANTFSNGSIYIPNYTSSNNKSISIDVVSENNATLAYANLEAWLWSQTSTITSLGFSGLYGGTLAQYSTATLYGILKS
jgi:hypothetical protein